MYCTSVECEMLSGMDADQTIRVALTTVANRTEADRLATVLVERKLAACVNIIGPVHSVYRWAGDIESAEEYLLLMKTDTANAASLEQAVRELHTYETPEFLILEIATVSETYTNWLLASLAK